MMNEKFNSLHVKQCCEGKLQISFRKGKELSGWYQIGKTKIARITIPKGRKKIGKGLYKKMADGLKLEVEQFDALLECTLGGGAYKRIVDPDSIY